MVNSPILQMFARSPFKPMQEHIVKAQASAAELIPFFEAVMASDWQAATASQQRITELEHEADDLKRDIRQRLPASLFLPVPRTDLLDMLRMQDKIANRAKDISGLMLGREMAIPEPIQQELLELLRTTLQAIEQAVLALNELDELLAAGFRGHEVDIVERLITELDQLEHKADEHERTLRSSLFAVERDLYPIDVMFLYQIIQWVGDLANLSQQVGNRLQQLLAR
ncbi:TIGR00153 family protein [Marinobacterium sp. AK62]|uniref:TIGR00153 family protein n=1 Tax=Marinobacterium alkalitolerans TaxID=1542925 RepID=A0ABS3Z644_9GAMM|nr:TIGR00153 family protein [Marinobacterium alkalitolerans]MBP0047186.1 TIGR00153 family protein [Marinobacterium alkalitolerans]